MEVVGETGAETGAGTGGEALEDAAADALVVRGRGRTPPAGARTRGCAGHRVGVGGHVRVHEGAAGAFRASGDTVLPLHDRLCGVGRAEAAPPARARVRGRALVHAGRGDGRHAVLSAGEHRAHVHHGFHRGRGRGGGAAVHRLGVGRHRAEGASACALLRRLRGGHGGSVPWSRSPAVRQTRMRACSAAPSLAGVGLALAAAATWAVYSLVTKKLSGFGYDSILVTRRTFVWGLLFMLPALPVLGFSPDWAALALPEVWGNLAFLGLGASAALLRHVERGRARTGSGKDEPLRLSGAGSHRAGVRRRARRAAHAPGGAGRCF